MSARKLPIYYDETCQACGTRAISSSPSDAPDLDAPPIAEATIYCYACLRESPCCALACRLSL